MPFRPVSRLFEPARRRGESLDVITDAENQHCGFSVPLHGEPVVVLDGAIHNLAVLTKKAPVAYVRTDAQAPLWQLGDGWYGQKDGFRWTNSHASATLSRPDCPRDFELVLNISPDHIRRTGPIAIALALNGRPIGQRQVSSAGAQTLHWPAPEGSASPQVAVDLEVTPEYRPSNGDTRRLGVAVVAFGFR
jgi:hypothetical protein